MAQRTITITIDTNDQGASARSLRDGINAGVDAYEQAFQGDGVKIGSYRTQDNEQLTMDFGPLPREAAFMLHSKGPQTVPLAKRGRKPSEKAA